MNILYFTALDDEDKSKTGIKNKIYGQCKAMEKLGHKVWLARFRGEEFVVSRSGNEVIQCKIKYGNNRLRCARAFRLIKERGAAWNINMLYIRNPSMCLSAYRFLKHMRKCKAIVMMELFTYPLNKERFLSAFTALKNKKIKNAVKEFLSLLLDNMYYPFLKNVVHRLVVLLPVKKIWGIETVYIQNGIDTEQYKPKSFIRTEHNITLIGVAYLSYWHGYDRLLRGLKSYYEKRGSEKKKIDFIVIGDGEQKAQMQEYVMTNGLEERVHFTGVKTGKDLEEYYDLADVGVAALGVHRKNIKYVSTLKSREYFAKGLPFIDSATDLAFTGEMNKYRLQVPADDSEINIEDVIVFAEKYRFQEKARDEMAAYASRYMDWKSQMSIVIECCEKLLIGNEGKHVTGKNSE